MADDRDALIATLAEEGWERVPNVDALTFANGMASITIFQWNGLAIVARMFRGDAPNSVILAAARAAVEAEQ